MHFGALSPQATIDDWRQGIAATRRLAAAARELLTDAGGEAGPEARAELDRLRDTLDRAQHELRSVPGPPSSWPDTTADAAAVWQNLVRFHDAAQRLGRAVTEVLTTRVAAWREAIARWQAPAGPAREPAGTGVDLPGFAAALDRLDEVVRALFTSPAVPPATAARVSATVQAIAALGPQAREVNNALASVRTLVVEGYRSPPATVGALLAYHWLTTDDPGPAPTADGLSDAGRALAAELARYQGGLAGPGRTVPRLRPRVWRSLRGNRGPLQGERSEPAPHLRGRASAQAAGEHHAVGPLHFRTSVSKQGPVLDAPGRQDAGAWRSCRSGSGGRLPRVPLADHRRSGAGAHGGPPFRRRPRPGGRIGALAATGARGAGAPAVCPT